MNSADRDYWVRRAGEEDMAAAAATSSQARSRHEEMASLYRARALLVEPASNPIPEPPEIATSTPADAA